MTRVGVVIPAAGAGRRMGAAKAELLLAGQPLLQRVLGVFLARADVQQIVVAVAADRLRQAPDWLRDTRIQLVAGGAERTDSVRAGLNALAPAIETVVIHDAARPLLSADLLERVIARARTGVAAIAALPATDTIHVVGAGDRIVITPARAELWQAQTPQAFPRAILDDAYHKAASERLLATDDAALVVLCGGDVRVVRGEPDNLKITVPRDLVVAEALFAQRA